MRPIAHYTFLELIRERWLHAVIVFVLFVFLACFPIGSLSFEEQNRVLFHFGSSAIHLSLIGFAILLGASRMPREVERQTSLIVLARSLTRNEFYLGKWFGQAAVLVVMALILYTVLLLLLLGIQHAEVDVIIYIQAAWGSIYEALLLLSLTMWGSLVVRPAVAFFLGVGLFLFGNWLPDMIFFAEKSKNPVSIALAKFSQYVFPNLYRLNWRSLNWLSGQSMDTIDFAGASLHAIGWSLLFLIFGLATYRRKDLV